MKVVQCENKHFYDADKYAVCPHCVPAGEKKNIQQEGKGNAAPSLPKRLAEKPCIRCGKGVAEDENFCRFCGMRAKPAVSQAQRSAVNNLPVNNSLESGKNNINSGIIKNKPTASNNDEKTVMTCKIVSSNVKGISYREHATRKHGKQKDKYFIIRYSANKKQITEAVGWMSEG